ncbi:rhomboid family intramembrane serine protease [Luteolibacter luteus]|jgi:membrane associated rhomboid family serine protease|uniref:Rhomboid family intramembrane serine protease n=1 Tax=Luteolibacter luteus TaxID=2728835 RepID=A0A858RI49_9BACT|nr:rhomboid family intramembrane serine protease [Luteolibacter luteus]QJE96395.1 rhomboid family intramembrane serine protease [Luteolibacter luteus]
MRRIRHDATQALFHAQGPLLVLITAMFAIYFLQWRSESGWYAPFMAVPQAVVESWNDLRGGSFDLADAKQFGTLVSYAFLHGSSEHVIYNMLFLWLFAALAVELLGQGWMLATFLITAVTGAITHVVLNADSPVPTLGASGAVMGFEGLYLGLAMRWHLPTPHVWPMARPIPPGQLALVGLAGVAIDYYSILSRSESNVAFGAHIGGFLGGVVLACLIPRKPQGARHR